MQQEIRAKNGGSAVLENCERLVLDGIEDVMEFDDTAITLSSNLGIVEIRGENMKIKSFDNATGSMTVEGFIYALVYKKDAKPLGFFARVFR